VQDSGLLGADLLGTTKETRRVYAGKILHRAAFGRVRPEG